MNIEEILELLQVMPLEDGMSYDVIEQCGSYNEELANYVIVIDSNDPKVKSTIEAWIHENVSQNVNNILAMANKNIAKFYKYVKSVTKQSYTELLIPNVSAFLNKTEESDDFAEVDAEIEVEDLSVDTDEEESQELEESAVEEEEEEPQDSEVEEEEEEPQETEEPQESAVEEEEEEQQELEEPQELAIEEEEEELQEEEPTAEEEEQIESILEISEMDLFNENDTNIEELPDTEIIEGKGDSTMNNINENDEQVATKLLDEARLLRVQAAQMLESINKREQIFNDKYTLISNVMTPSGDFVGFNDENKYLEMLSSLKTLDSRIFLDTLDPDSVLGKVELSKAFDLISDYSPIIVKNFLLSLISNANSDTEFIRSSLLVHKFTEYIKNLEV